MLKFIPYTGDTGELITSKNHINFEWIGSNCHIIFSISQQGNGAVCHFTSDKAGLRILEQVINEWCEFCFWLFDWCKIIIGVIKKTSVKRLAEKCGFNYVGSFGKKSIYVRRR